MVVDGKEEACAGGVAVASSRPKFGPTTRRGEVQHDDADPAYNHSRLWPP